MIVDLPRRWRWVVVAGCVLVLALAVVFVWSTKTAERRAAIALPVAPVRVSETVEAAPPPAPVEPVDTSASAPRGVDQIEVCGGGWVAVDAQGAPDLAAIDAATGLNAKAQAVLQRMRDSGVEFNRATATLLTADREPGWLDRLFGSAGDSARDTLARLASATADPAVYGLAFRSCAQPGSDAYNNCHLLNAPRWAQLDPGNAHPWLFVLDAARARNDRVGEAEALHHIASAERDDSGYLATVPAILGALSDADGDLLAGRALVTTAVNNSAMSASVGMQALLALCRGDALQDANRVQTCQAVAELLLDRSDTLLARAMGIAVGRQLGWPADRVDALRGQATAYYDTAAARMADEGSLACPALRRTLNDLRGRAAVGEAAALRDWVAQSGKTPADFIAIEQARRAAFAQVPASAASGS